jgi:hypothetical protein
MIEEDLMKLLNRYVQEFVLEIEKLMKKKRNYWFRLLVNNVRNSSSDRQSAINGERDAEKLVSSERIFHASINFSWSIFASNTILWKLI